MAPPLRSTGGSARQLRTSPITAALLLLLLALLTPASATTYIEMSGSITHFEEAYNDHVMLFEGTYTVGVASLVVQSTSCTVAGSGLTVQGYRNGAPPTKRTLQMTFTGLHIADSSVTFRDTLPPNSHIRVVGASAPKQGDNPVFILEDVYLRSNVTFIIESTSVQYGEFGIDAVVVALRPTTHSIVIDDRSGLFILDSRLQWLAGLLWANSYGSVVVSNNSALVVEGVKIKEAIQTVVNLHAPLLVSNNSLFRFTDVRFDAAAFSITDHPAILYHSVVDVKRNSLYYVANMSWMGTFTGGFMKTDGPYGTWFQVDHTSTATFYNIQNFDEFSLKYNPLPANEEQGARMRLGNLSLRVPSPTPDNDYVNFGFMKTFKEIDENGKFIKTSGGTTAGTCARAACVPGNSVLPLKEGSTCTCVCAGDASEPFCAGTSSDPTQLFWWDGKTPLMCGVVNCDLCDRMDNGRCVTCADGYKLTAERGCKAS